MSSLDWTVVALYAAGMIGLSLFLGRGQKSQEDYYVGGRDMPWWAIGISTMATQTSAISFISIPAFVALKPGGGLTWLQYELAVPLAMIGVACNLYLWVFVPELFWMWWNFTGLLVAVLVTFLVSRFRVRVDSSGAPSDAGASPDVGGSDADPAPETIRKYTLPGRGFFEREPLWQPAYSLLVLYFLLLLGILLFLNHAAENLIPAA